MLFRYSLYPNSRPGVWWSMMTCCPPRVHRSALEDTDAARKKEVWLGIKGDECQFDWRGRKWERRSHPLLRSIQQAPASPVAVSTRLAAAIAGPWILGLLSDNHLYKITLTPSSLIILSRNHAQLHDLFDQSLARTRLLWQCQRVTIRPCFENGHLCTVINSPKDKESQS